MRRSKSLTVLFTAAVLFGANACAANPNINLEPQRAAQIQAMQPTAARQLGYELALEDAKGGSKRRVAMSTVWHGAGALAGPVGYAVAWWLHPEGTNMRVEEDLHPTIEQYAAGYRDGLDRQMRKDSMKGKLFGGVIGTAVLLTAIAAGS